MRHKLAADVVLLHATIQLRSGWIQIATPVQNTWTINGALVMEPTEAAGTCRGVRLAVAGTADTPRSRPVVAMGPRLHFSSVGILL